MPRTAKDGRIELDVNLADETIWLTQQQLADLFGIQRPAITRKTHDLLLSRMVQQL